MFFVLSKILSFLTAPTTWISGLILAGIFLKRKRWHKKALTAGLILFFFFTNPYIAKKTFIGWEVDPVAISELKKHDIAVVFSGMTNSGMKPHDRIYFNKAADRIMMAVHLYKIGKVDKILISGGKGAVVSDYKPEAETLKDFLLMLGIPEDDIIQEKKADNTYQNAVFTKELVDEKYPNSSLVLITSAFHMRRAYGCAQKAGLDCTPFAVDYYYNPDTNSPDALIVPDSGALYKWDVLIHEIIGYLVYWLTGKL